MKSIILNCRSVFSLWVIFGLFSCAVPLKPRPVSPKYHVKEGESALAFELYNESKVKSSEIKCSLSGRKVSGENVEIEINLESDYFLYSLPGGGYELEYFRCSRYGIFNFYDERAFLFEKGKIFYLGSLSLIDRKGGGLRLVHRAPRRFISKEFVRYMRNMHHLQEKVDVFPFYGGSALLLR
jgi:hypothetical protein